MPKPLKAGGEVDSWCTKCKLFLNHRIIAMIGSKPARVECSTCGSHHNYRAASPGEKPETSARANAKLVSPAGAGGRVRTPRGPTKAQQEIAARELQWEKSISGKSPRDFKAYRTTQSFQQGELVRHSKFGDGVVTRVVDAHKVEILFKDEPRTLAQALTD
jgi:hypothetical protein